MKKTIKKQTQSNSNGISFAGLLFLLFLGLKLGGVGQVATWSWWWVTAPLWGFAALIIGISIVAVLMAFFGAAIFRLIKLILNKLQSKPIGTLNISCTPNSILVLNGKVLGSTPKSVKVKPGVHQLTFINPDGDRFQKSVLVVAKETVSVTHKF